MMPKQQHSLVGKGILENELKNIFIQFTSHAYQISAHAFTGTLATLVEVFRLEDNVNQTE